jgi:PiT family inorganic phosphate transporter
MLSGGAFGEGVNWAQAQEVGMSLLISPVFGFLCAGMLLLVLKMLVRNPALFTEPEKGRHRRSGFGPSLSSPAPG